MVLWQVEKLGDACDFGDTIVSVAFHRDLRWTVLALGYLGLTVACMIVVVNNVTYRQDILFGRNKIIRNETIVILVLFDKVYQLFI